MFHFRTLNGTPLDVYPKTQVAVNMECPIFDRDTIERIYTYPTKLPLTPRNVVALGFANRLDVRVNAKQEAELWLGNKPFERGIIRVTRASRESIEVVFQNKFIDLSESLSRVKLRELDIPVEVTEPLGADIVISAVFGIPSGGKDKMAVQINEHLFTASFSQEQTIVDAINEIWPGIAELGESPNSYFIWINLTNVPDPDEFQIYLRPVVDNAEEYIFFVLEESNVLDQLPRIHADWNTFLASSNDQVAFPVFKAPNLYEGKNTPYLGYANYRNSAGIHPNDPDTTWIGGAEGEGWPHTIIPAPYLQALWPSIAEAIDIKGFAGIFLEDPDIQKLAFWSNKPLDFPLHIASYIGDWDQDKEYHHVYRTDFNLVDHVPDLTAMDLLKGLSGTFFLYLSFKQGRIHLTPVRNLLNSKPEDWTHLVEPNYKLDIDEAEAYTLDYDRPKDEIAEPNQLLRVDGGSGAEPFIAPFFSVYERSETDPIDGSRAWRVAVCNDEGISRYFDVESDLNMRLLFDHGAQPDSEANDYPFGGHGRYNYKNEAVGDYSLDWSGDGGLFDAWAREYIRLITRGRRVTFPMRLTMKEIMELRNWTHVKKTIYTEDGQVTGIIQSVRFKASVNGISIAEVTLVI